MKLKKKLITLACGLLTMVAHGENQRPNVLLLFADDMRADTINNPEVLTPTLDKLVSGGFVIESLHNFGGNTGAVCIPARNMLMTGKSWMRFDAGPRDKGLGATLPKAFKAAGYQTWYREKSGKSNLPHIQKQFDEYADIHMVSELRTGYACRNVANEAIEYIETGRDKAKPFFMYIGLPAPHDPRFNAPEFIELYKDRKVSLPDDFLPMYPWNPSDKAVYVRAEHHTAWPRDPEVMRGHIRDYYTLITNMDYDLGRIIKSLEEQGIRDNTIILFSADQGLAVGSQGMMAKQMTHSSFQHVPCIFNAPGLEKGSSKSLGYTLDLFPTLCDLAGIDAPENIDGKSLVPVLRGEKEMVRDRLFFAMYNNQRSLHKGDWKLIQYAEINKTLLFNKAKDPYETENLADNPEFASTVTAMMEELRAEQGNWGDEAPLTVDNPRDPVFVVNKKNADKAAKYPREKVGGLAPEWKPGNEVDLSGPEYRQ